MPKRTARKTSRSPRPTEPRIRLQQLSAAVALCLAAGIIGSLVTADAIPVWYANLRKPAFTPPNWIFGPVWTALYVLLGFVLYRLWRLPSSVKAKSSLLHFFYLQLAANMVWSMLFFGAKTPLWAFFDIAVLWYMIAYLTLRLQKTDKVSALLLLPYFLWVSFATLLNYSVWQLNL